MGELGTDLVEKFEHISHATSEHSARLSDPALGLTKRGGGLSFCLAEIDPWTLVIPLASYVGTTENTYTTGKPGIYLGSDTVTADE